MNATPWRRIAVNGGIASQLLTSALDGGVSLSLAASPRQYILDPVTLNTYSDIVYTHWRCSSINTGDLALQVGGVSDETVKYGHEFCGTWTQEWLLWQGLEAIVQVNYRPVLSSERVPHIKKPAIVRQKTKIWSWAPDGSPTPRQTGRLTVGHKLTSTSTRVIKLCWIICPCKFYLQSP
jgi:hypothetical protein